MRLLLDPDLVSASSLDRSDLERGAPKSAPAPPHLGMSELPETPADNRRCTLLGHAATLAGARFRGDPGLSRTLHRLRPESLRVAAYNS
jgi:hypothetical protein